MGLLVVGALVVVRGVSVGASPHPGQSANVAVIDSTEVTNGGEFPTTTSGPTGAFTDFTFTNVAVADVNAANLAAYDTVLLNVASPGIACDLNTLTAAQKADLVAFAAGGKKLIIYDSECQTGDYSWLPFPFNTSNPGAAGATGTFSIVENNLLASGDPADPHFIDAALLSGDTDAIGDANVFTTFDPNWCVADTGTNTLGVNGPLHTYSRVGGGATTGLVIYNGMDVDDLDASTVPDASSGAGNLAKLWLQELQQPLAGTGLPCQISAVGISLSPTTATNLPGTAHTVTAHVTDPVGAPQAGAVVTFSVLTGPNAGATGTCSANANCSTDANGDVSFTYTGSATEGTDEIQACFPGPAGQACSVKVTKVWSATAPTTTTIPGGTTTTVVGGPTTTVVGGTTTTLPGGGPATTVPCPTGSSAGSATGNNNVNTNCNSSTNNNTNTNTNTQDQTNDQTQTGGNNTNENSNVINVLQPGVHFGHGPLEHASEDVVETHAPLSRTGSEVKPLVVGGGLALLVGGLLLLGSRRVHAGAVGHGGRRRFGKRSWL